MMGPVRTGRERGPVTGSSRDDYERTKNAPLGTVLVEDYERVKAERDRLRGVVETVAEPEFRASEWEEWVADLGRSARAALSEVQR